MENNFIVSVNPHVYGKRNTTGVMLDVIIALLPAVVASVVLFGARAAMVIGVCVVSCVIFEYLFTLICKRPVSVGDLSAVVTGILLALNIPSTIPLWQAVVGSFIAIVVVKCLFGGIGRNFANPAITARVVMLIAFTGTMTDIVFPVQKVDTVATATPLSALPMGGVEAVDASLLDMFLGVRGGALGETSAAALLLGFVYLLVRRVIRPHITLSIWATVAVVSLIFWLCAPERFTDPLFNLLTGGMILGSCFMATDYVTSPMSIKGGVIFGVGIGFITMMIRYFGSYPEGMSFAILIMNAVVPLLNMWFHQKKYGRD